MMKLSLRRATASDAKLLFKWVNDPIIRQMAFSPDPIRWENHQIWFRNRLDDENSFIYIAINSIEQPVGQIRFDKVNLQEAEIDVHIAPSLRGRGIGSNLIQLGVRHFLEDTAVDKIHAIIKEENMVSRRAFEKAGFENLGLEKIKGVSCWRMIHNS